MIVVSNSIERDFAMLRMSIEFENLMTCWIGTMELLCILVWECCTRDTSGSVAVFAQVLHGDFGWSLFRHPWFACCFLIVDPQPVHSKTQQFNPPTSSCSVSCGTDVEPATTSTTNRMKELLLHRFTTERGPKHSSQSNGHA